MLNIGSKIIELRKFKGWSQAELAEAVNASRDIIGKYERNDNLPSLEMALKIAKIFDVSVDYLIGENVNAAFDKEMITRLENVEALPQEEKNRIFHFIDLISLSEITRLDRLTLINEKAKLLKSGFRPYFLYFFGTQSFKSGLSSSGM